MQAIGLLLAQGTRKLLATVTALPENAGTRAARQYRSAQLPVAVPAKRSETTRARKTRPLLEKVTCTFPFPPGLPA